MCRVNLTFLGEEVVHVLLDVGVGLEDLVADSLLDGGLELRRPRDGLLLVKLLEHCDLYWRRLRWLMKCCLMGYGSLLPTRNFDMKAESHLFKRR